MKRKNTKKRTHELRALLIIWDECLHVPLKNLNEVFTCTRKYNVDKEGFRLSSEPGMPGRLLPYNVPYLVDELFCMMVNVKGQRLLQTAADPTTPAKDRSGRLNKIEKPDLNFIFNKIKGV